MRRGLISRSAVELPDAVLEGRLDRLRAAMRDAQLDALAVYTNNTRPGGVSWLTGFVPYWSEALLVVPSGGPPFLVAALSLRVKSWIERTSRIGAILHNPRVGLKAAQQIASISNNAVLGVVDLDGLPTGIADDLRDGGPDLVLRDATALFASQRGKADPAEIALASKSAGMAHQALVQAQGDTLNAMIAAVELKARLLGAEEIYIAAAPDLTRSSRLVRIEGEQALGETYALRATLAYKGTWVRLARTFCPAGLARQAAVRLAEAVAQLPSERGFAGFACWLVEGCRIAQPLETLMGARLSAANPPVPGALVSVQGTLALDGRTVLVGAPALLGAPGEPASLLIDPLYE